MARGLVRVLIVLVLLVILAVAPGLRFPGPDVSHAEGDPQEEIDRLLEAYAAALAYELEHGTTAAPVDPASGEARVLVGTSQAKMDALWAETLAKINALQARPRQERAAMADVLRKLSGHEPSYLSLARTAHDPSAVLEEYAAGSYFYHVDVASGGATKVWLRDQADYRIHGRRSDRELLELARGHVQGFSPGLSLEGLSLITQHKEGVVFYRWEDAARLLPDGTRPFVQVALSRAGDLLNFENTLPFARDDTVWNLPHGAGFAAVAPAYALGANEVYANGGSRWAWELLSGTYSTRSNAGYCYFAGWCSPKNFYYASSPSGNNTYSGTNHRAKWTATSYMRYRNTRVSAYIPCTNATAFVFYRKWYNGGSSSIEDGVDQNIWCNTWVQMSGSLYDIQRVVLPNTNERASTQQIAWDEIWDYVP